MSKLEMWAWSELQVPVKSIPPGPPLLFFDPFLSRKQLRKVHQFRWFANDCIEIHKYTGLFVSQTETADKNKIVKAWRECEEILHTLRDHHTKVLHGGPLECIAEKWQDINELPAFSPQVWSKPSFPCVHTNQRKWWKSCFWIGF